MYSDSPDRNIMYETKNHVEWYDSPSTDITNSGHRLYSQRVPLRPQKLDTNIKKESLSEEGTFDLFGDDDDSDTLCTRSLLKPLDIDSTSQNLLWKKEKSKESSQASEILSLLKEHEKAAKECMNKSKSFYSKPKPRISHNKSGAFDSSIVMATPTSSTRKRTAIFANNAPINESPLATSTPKSIVNRPVNKPQPFDFQTPMKKPKFDDSFDDETLDDKVFENIQKKHPELIKKSESQVSTSSLKTTQLPDIISTPKAANPAKRSQIKVNATPKWMKSKSMTDAKSRNMVQEKPVILPSVQQQPSIPKQTVLKTKSTPVRKARSFAVKDDFLDDDIFNFPPSLASLKQ
jgi:hypothetical protein